MQIRVGNLIFKKIFNYYIVSKIWKYYESILRHIYRVGTKTQKKVSIYKVQLQPTFLKISVFDTRVSAIKEQNKCNLI